MHKSKSVNLMVLALDNELPTISRTLVLSNDNPLQWLHEKVFNSFARRLDISGSV